MVPGARALLLLSALHAGCLLAAPMSETRIGSGSFDKTTGPSISSGAGGTQYQPSMAQTNEQASTLQVTAHGGEDDVVDVTKQVHALNVEQTTQRPKTSPPSTVKNQEAESLTKGTTKTIEDAGKIENKAALDIFGPLETLLVKSNPDEDLKDAQMKGDELLKLIKVASESTALKQHPDLRDQLVGWAEDIRSTFKDVGNDAKEYYNAEEDAIPTAMRERSGQEFVKTDNSMTERPGGEIEPITDKIDLLSDQLWFMDDAMEKALGDEWTSLTAALSDFESPLRTYRRRHLEKTPEHGYKGKPLERLRGDNIVALGQLELKLGGKWRAAY